MNWELQSIIPKLVIIAFFLGQTNNNKKTKQTEKKKIGERESIYPEGH